MRTRTLLGLAALLTLASLVALWSIRSEAADGPKLVVSGPSARKLIEDDIKELQKALQPAKVEKRDQRRAKVLAMCIALNSQSLMATGSGDKATLGGNYETAIKVAEALHDDKVADAKTAAAGFGKAKATAVKPVDVTKYLKDGDDLDIDTGMQPFKSTRAGGLGIEKMIKDIAEAPKNPPAKDLPKIATMANRAATMTMYLEHLAPKENIGKRTKAAWTKYINDLRIASMEAAAAAEKKDAAATKAALAKMDVSCVACHEIFKTK